MHLLLTPDKLERELPNFADAHFNLRRQQNSLIRVQKKLGASKASDKFKLA
jgi:hypothetical protein